MESTGLAPVRKNRYTAVVAHKEPHVSVSAIVI